MHGLIKHHLKHDNLKLGISSNFYSKCEDQRLKFLIFLQNDNINNINNTVHNINKQTLPN